MKTHRKMFLPERTLSFLQFLVLAYSTWRINRLHTQMVQLRGEHYRACFPFILNGDLRSCPLTGQVLHLVRKIN